jgi:hypothetical protein
VPEAPPKSSPEGRIAEPIKLKASSIISKHLVYYSLKK